MKRERIAYSYTYTCELGNKQYEMSNHLENCASLDASAKRCLRDSHPVSYETGVLVLASDVKTIVHDGGVITGYAAQVISAKQMRNILLILLMVINTMSCFGQRLPRNHPIDLFFNCDGCDSVKTAMFLDTVRGIYEPHSRTSIEFKFKFLSKKDSVRVDVGTVSSCYEFILRPTIYNWKSPLVNFNLATKCIQMIYVEYKDRIFGIPYIPYYDFIDIEFADKRKRTLNVHYSCRSHLMYDFE